MISGQGAPRDLYDGQIVAEIRNIHAKPLSYDASKLLETLDEFELDPRFSVVEYNATYASIHLAAHIINLDFMNAKFLYKRLNEEVRKNDRIKIIGSILQSVLQRRYEDIIPNVNGAIAAINNAGDDLTLLLEACIPVLRFLTLRYLTKTFENFALKDFARYLSLGEEEALQYAVKNGWRISDNNFLKAPEKIDISDKEFRGITEAQFKNLSETISFLETI